jgi:MFS family permease
MSAWHILRNMSAALNATAPLTTKQWLIVVTAGMGFAFDLYELVVQAIVLRPMLMELGPFKPGTPEFNHWAGLMLFLPAVVGGLGGFAGGYLIDRIGRQRLLVWSIVFYGAAAFFSGIATSLQEVIFWRCVTVAGVCVEFVAATAWLAELFPEPKRREKVLGWSQAFASLGNFMIAGAYYAAVTWGESFPEVQGGHSAWRYTLIIGALPAIPIMLIRPFLPESPAWSQRRIDGTLPRTRIRDLFGPKLRRVTLVSTVLVACCYALAIGMLQHIPRVVPGLPGVSELARTQQEQWVSWVHLHADVGAVLGRVLLAGLVVWFVARVPMLRAMIIAGLALFPFVLVGPPIGDADWFKYGALAITLLVSVQYSFWGNYLPRVFPMHLRGSGESFAISVGGRMFAPLAALATTQLSNVMPGASAGARLAASMAVVAVAASLLALLVSRWLPEPPARLPEESDA